MDFRRDQGYLVQWEGLPKREPLTHMEDCRGHLPIPTYTLLMCSSNAVMVECGTMWQNMTETEKAPYKDMAEKEKKRWDAAACGPPAPGLW